jgi:hypothetical protein
MIIWAEDKEEVTMAEELLSLCCESSILEHHIFNSCDLVVGRACWGSFFDFSFRPFLDVWPRTKESEKAIQEVWFDEWERLGYTRFPFRIYGEAEKDARMKLAILEHKVSSPFRKHEPERLRQIEEEIAILRQQADDLKPQEDRYEFPWKVTWDTEKMGREFNDSPFVRPLEINLVTESEKEAMVKEWRFKPFLPYAEEGKDNLQFKRVRNASKYAVPANFHMVKE